MVKGSAVSMGMEVNKLMKLSKNRKKVLDALDLERMV